MTNSKLVKRAPKPSVGRSDHLGQNLLVRWHQPKRVPSLHRLRLHEGILWLCKGSIHINICLHSLECIASSLEMLVCRARVEHLVHSVRSLLERRNLLVKFTAILE